MDEVDNSYSDSNSNLTLPYSINERKCRSKSASSLASPKDVKKDVYDLQVVRITDIQNDCSPVLISPNLGLHLM